MLLSRSAVPVVAGMAGVKAIPTLSCRYARAKARALIVQNHTNLASSLINTTPPKCAIRTRRLQTSSAAQGAALAAEFKSPSFIPFITTNTVSAPLRGAAQSEQRDLPVDEGDSAYSTAEKNFSIQPSASVWHADKPYHLELGGSIENLHIAYETWGQLSSARDNTILLHTGLSAHTHAASNELDARPGWWEKFIGPGRALDTNKYFVICANVIGSCYGSTGPSTINPDTGRPYGTDLPAITVEDMVRAQFLVLDSFKIDTVHASVGSSLGGMQSLAAAALYPDRVKRVVSISAAARSHPSSIAIRFAQRQAIVADPNWQEGHYYNTGRYPLQGMKNARIIGTISYRSGPEWERRFSNMRVDPQAPLNRPHTKGFAADFQIESYLAHQCEQFCTRYDPNSLLYISKAMDMFDLGRGFNSLGDGLRRIKAPALVLGVQSDILFPVKQQKEIADLLKAGGQCPRVTYYELDAMYGHDTFLLDVRNVGRAVKGHVEHS